MSKYSDYLDKKFKDAPWTPGIHLFSEVTQKQHYKEDYGRFLGRLYFYTKKHGATALKFTIWFGIGYAIGHTFF